MPGSKAESETTEVIQDEKRILQSIMSFISGARSRLDLCMSYLGARTGAEFVDALRSAKKRGVRTRLVTEVGNENLRAMRVASQYIEIRHLAGLRSNSWSVTDDEYLSSLAIGEFRASLPIIYSTAKSLVAEHQSIFDALWSRGELLEDRAAALESGTDLPEVEIVRDSEKARQTYLDLVKKAKREILLLLPTPEAFHRDDMIGVIDILEGRASKGVKVNLLVPVDQQVLARLTPRSPGSGISFRAVPPAVVKETVTLVVVDRATSLAIDERDPAQKSFELAFGSALVTTREPMVRQNRRLFERIWIENTLREAEVAARVREEANRKRAELMQDILTHDIRNFNQVARLNAELLVEEVKGKEATARAGAIIRAVDGSTKLIERAKKLGSILAAKNVDLRPTSLKASLDRSVLLIRRGNPAARLKLEGTLSGEVLADELLDEVFVNILSNSVKYTDGKVVGVVLGQKPAELPGNQEGFARRCWKISISDRGRGIPDGQKAGAFKRYLETAKGSGLGLSIVHALVNDRYGGKVELKDRIENDFTKGTTIEIWLPRP
jgi:signal transduction histidine kinase